MDHLTIVTETGTESGASYRCPGEATPISTSVHLARLAAGYSECRQCVHRVETETLPRLIVRRCEQDSSSANLSQLTWAGIQGRYLNEMTPDRMRTCLAAILAHLDGDIGASTEAACPRRLRVVVGHDFRDASADLVRNVVAMVRNWGCEIADAGRVTRPCFEFTVSRLHPDVGLFVTGGDAPADHCGLSVVDSEAIPWTHPGRLSELNFRSDEIGTRSHRQPGRHEILFPLPTYQQHLEELCHAIRPLRIAFACGDPLVMQTLQSLMEYTPCSGQPVGVDPLGRGALRHQLIDKVIECHVDVGFLIGRDGQSLEVFDECGEPMDLPVLVAMLWPSKSEPFEPTDAICERVNDAQLSDQRRFRGPLIADAEGRFWWPDQVPGCDALQTLLTLLQTISREDRRLSEYRQLSTGVAAAQGVRPGV